MANTEFNADSGDSNLVGSNANTDNGDSGAPRGGPRIGEPITIDPAAVRGGGDNGNNSSTGEPIRKRRGRKPGSTNRTKAQATAINGLESILYSSHAMLATILKVDELNLDEKEAKLLADAANAVARHYDLSATQKSVDWANLIMLAGTIYGTRAMAYRATHPRNRPVNEILRRPPTEEPIAQPSTNGSGRRTVEIPGVGKVEVQ